MKGVETGPGDSSEQPAPPLRVVFDCNIYFQALISPHGPSGECMNLALSGKVALFASGYAMRELRETAATPELRSRFRYDEARVSALIENVERVAHFAVDVPDVFVHPRDPDDAHYVNLALSAGCTHVVSRDNDLLHLCDPRRVEGRAFMETFPILRIVQPPELLTIVRGA